MNFKIFTFKMIVVFHAIVGDDVKVRDIIN